MLISNTFNKDSIVKLRCIATKGTQEQKSWEVSHSTYKPLNLIISTIPD